MVSLSITRVYLGSITHSPETVSSRSANPNSQRKQSVWRPKKAKQTQRQSRQTLADPGARRRTTTICFCASLRVPRSSFHPCFEVPGKPATRDKILQKIEVQSATPLFVAKFIVNGNALTPLRGPHPNGSDHGQCTCRRSVRNFQVLPSNRGQVLLASGNAVRHGHEARRQR